MSIRPEGTTLTLIASGASSTIICDSIQLTFETEVFDRLEFSNDKLRTAKNPDGSTTIFLTRFGGGVTQLITTCGYSSVLRPLQPDDSNITNIKKRWNIIRYRIQGLASLPVNVDQILTVLTDHKKRLARYITHLAKAGMDLSFNYLTTVMQPETFSYLTTTGAQIIGPTIENGILNNCLITDFVENIEFEIPNQDGTSTLYKSFTMTIENRVLDYAEDG